MNAPTQQDPRRVDRPDEHSTLTRIQRRLEELLGDPAPELQTSSVNTLGDEFIVCGIVGGKDVGKTTLLRTLIGVERDSTPETTEGTSRPCFYVHRDQVGCLSHRFPNPGNGEPRSAGYDILPHERDSLRTLVLVDLPDFDSEYADHLRIVERTLPLLDRVVWVMSPRKAADRTWLDLFRRFAKDGANVYYVLSKGDELLADALPHGVNHRQHSSTTNGVRNLIEGQRDWFTRQLHLAQGEPEYARMFVVAAGHAGADHICTAIAETWDDPTRTKFGSDYPTVQGCARMLVEEVERLRGTLMSPLSHDSMFKVKQANRVVALRQDVKRIRDWSRLELWIQRLAAITSPESRDHYLADHFPMELRNSLALALTAGMPSEGEAAGELFAWRAERYPLLRLLSHPLGGLVRLTAKYLTSGNVGATPGQTHFGHQLQSSLRNSVSNLRQQFIEENQPLLARFRMTERLPSVEALVEQVSTQVSQTTQAAADGFANQLKEHAGRRSGLLTGFLIAITLWFPLIQPLTEAGLLLLGADGFSMTLQAAAKLVVALGPAKLLQGLLVVLLIYFICIAAIYRRSIRDVRRLRSEWTAGAWNVEPSADVAPSPEDELLRNTAIRSLMAPLTELHDELKRRDDQLRELEYRHD